MTQLFTRIDPAVAFAVGFFALVFLIAIAVVAWQTIPCRWLGPHKWIELDRMAQPWPERDADNSDLLLRVCEQCELIQDDITPARELLEKQKTEKKTEQQRGWDILAKYGYKPKSMVRGGAGR